MHEFVPRWLHMKTSRAHVVQKCPFHYSIVVLGQKADLFHPRQHSLIGLDTAISSERPSTHVALSKLSNCNPSRDVARERAT
jgi:hypothetical protein